MQDETPPLGMPSLPVRPWQASPHGEHKPFLLRELWTVVSSHGLAVDHQRKVVKRTLRGGVMGRGGQTFTICGDFGLACGIYVVPDTALSWAKETMVEMVERHQAAGVAVPGTLYMDCACCNGKPCAMRPATPTSSHGAATPVPVSPPRVDIGMGVAALWRHWHGCCSTVATLAWGLQHCVDIGTGVAALCRHWHGGCSTVVVPVFCEAGCHAPDTEDPCRKKLLTDLSKAIFVQHTGDCDKLTAARQAADLQGPPTRTERVKFIRQVVNEPTTEQSGCWQC